LWYDYGEEGEFELEEEDFFEDAWDFD